MHLEVQEGVGAEGHNVSTPARPRTEAAHGAEPCWGEGGSLEVRKKTKRLMRNLLQMILNLTKTLNSATTFECVPDLEVDLQQ